MQKPVHEKLQIIFVHIYSADHYAKNSAWNSVEKPVHVSSEDILCKKILQKATEKFRARKFRKNYIIFKKIGQHLLKVL